MTHKIEKHIKDESTSICPDAAYDFSGVVWDLVTLCGSQIGYPLP